MKATKSQVKAITELAVNDMLAELSKPNGSFTFGHLRDVINAAFGPLEFNWMTAVRNPMQSLINDGFMVRDVTDIRGPELYVRGPKFKA